MQEKKKVFLTLVVILVVEGVQSSEYSNQNCPICYNPAENVPGECMTDGITSEEIAAKTKACASGEYCVKWTFPEDESVPSQLRNQLLNEEDNAKYWCSDPSVVQSTWGRMGGTLRIKIEVPTAMPSGESTTQQATTTEGGMIIVTEKDEEAGPTTEESPSDDDDNMTEAPVRECQVGMELQGEDCVDCKLNSYKGEDDEECVHCPDGKITIGVASTSVDDCIPACGPGYYLKKGKCKTCDPNTYSDQPHNTACTSCPDGTSNELSARDSESTCEEKLCSPGNYFDEAGRHCQVCEENTYMADDDHQNSECKDCPPGTISNPGASECVSESNEVDNTTDEEDSGSIGLFLSNVLICLLPILVL